MGISLQGDTNAMLNQIQPLEIAHLDLFSVEWYSEHWLSIPKTEMEAFAGDFPYQSEDGLWTTRKVLMHERRVTEEHQNGKAPLGPDADSGGVQGVAGAEGAGAQGR